MYNYPIAYFGGRSYRRVGVPLLPKYFNCDGNERSLSQCESHHEYSIVGYYESLAGIHCTAGMYQ